MTGKADQKSFETPDETRTFGPWTCSRSAAGRSAGLTLQPGWRWSQDVKPLAGTEVCEAPHFQYHLQGTLHIVMSGGAEFDARPDPGAGAGPSIPEPARQADRYSQRHRDGIRSP